MQKLAGVVAAAAAVFLVMLAPIAFAGGGFTGFPPSTPVTGANIAPNQVTAVTVIADGGTFDTANIGIGVIGVGRTNSNVGGVPSGNNFCLDYPTCTFQISVNSSKLRLSGTAKTDGDLSVGTLGSGDLILYRDMYRGGASPKILCSNTAPTVSSGFGSSPSIASNNGTCGFSVNVGTGGSASSGVIGLPTASTGWHCQCDDITHNSSSVFVTRQTAASTTSCTITNFNTSAAATAWTASDILYCSAIPVP